jgi:cytochrome c-type biogenesis protein CcsB
VELALLQLAGLAYLVAALALGGHVLRPRARLATTGTLALATGFLLHSAAIAIQLVRLGLPPVTTFHEGLSFFSWLIVGSCLIVSRSSRLTVLGAIVSPLACAMILAAVALYGDAASAAEMPSAWLRAHIMLVFLGASVFASAFAISIVYLVQEHLLKSRRRGWMIRRLPSLEQLDRLNYRCLVWGFPMLSLGILSGWIWATTVGQSFWSWEALEIFSVVTWLIYAGLLQFRMTAGLRGRRAATLTIVAFGLVVVSFLSVNLLPLPGRHGGGIGL